MKPKPNIIDVQELLQGEKEIGISHNGETYRLKVTNQGKLLLTKDWLDSIHSDE